MTTKDTERLHAEEHALRIFEERNRAFRVIFDTVMEVEGASDEDVFLILCRNLVRLCAATTAALASYNPAEKTMTLECVCRQSGNGPETVMNQTAITAPVTDKTVEKFRERQVQECHEHKGCLVDIFSGSSLDEMDLSREDNCYRLSCVRDGELLAGGLVQLPPGNKLKLKDMIDTFMNLAGLIVQRIYIYRSLEASEKRYRAVVEDQTEFLCRFRPDLKMIFINQALSKLAGLPAEELIGESIKRFLDESQQEALLKRLQTLTPDRPAMSMEQLTPLPDGTTRWTSWVNRAIFNDAGEVIEYQGVGRDITERKKTQKALEESESRLRTLFESMQPGLLLIDAENHRIADVNPSACEMIGLPKEKIVDAICHKFIGPWEEDSCPINDLEKNIDREERTLVTAAGSRVPILKTVTTITIDEHPYLLESFIDITDLKQSRESLKQSEKEKAIILNSLDELVSFQDRELRVIWANRAAAESVGLDKSQIHGQHCYEIWQQRSAPCENCPVLVAMKTGSTQEHEMTTPDGRVWYIRGYPVSDEKGNIIGAVEITQNITERKRNEEALLLHSLVYRSMQEAVLVFDLDDRIIDINQAAEEMFGWSRDELLGKKADILNPPERVGEIADEIRQGLEDNEVWEGELHIVTRSGEHRIMSTIVSSIYDREGRLIGNIGIDRDITERKSVQEALVESERRHRAVVENANEAILVAQDGLLKFFNRKTAEITGYSPEELAETAFIDLIHPDDKEMVAKRYKRRLKGDSLPPVYSFRIVTKSGTTKWVEINAVLFHWEDKPATLNFLSDITERKEAEEALRESQERFKRAAECASDLIYEWDIANDTLTWYGDINAALGYAPGEFPHTLDAWSSIIHPDDLPHMEEAIQIQRDKGENMITEYRVRHRNGEWLSWTDRGTIVPNEKGEPARMIGVCTDITVRKRLEGEVIKGQKLESLGILAGGLAHDFNNLLMSIMGNISLSKLSLSGDDEIRQSLDDAEASCLQARNLTQQLLTFARGGQPVRKCLFISNLLRDATRFSLSGSKNDASFSIADDLWPIDADSGQINQVINNLSINAAQAMPDGGRIEVTAKNIIVTDDMGLALKKVEHILITFQDCGVGIPDKYIGKIFDPYFTTKKQGSGLGLTTVYSIIKNHNGLIAVTSRPGTGTTFSVYLPASEAIAAPMEIEEQEIVRGKGSILLMDDDESVRTVSSRMLEKLGYDVKTAAHGEEAVSIFMESYKSGSAFDAVILDLTVKTGMGGEEAAREIKQIEPEASIIVTSGYSTDSIMADFERYGFCGVIVKPYKIKDLGKLMRQVIPARGK
jgi:PAS domain S-box-containing protein